MTLSANSLIASRYFAHFGAKCSAFFCDSGGSRSSPQSQQWPLLVHLALHTPYLSNAKESFQRGVMPGAFLGAVLGLFPGRALSGALVGGAIALAVVTSQKALKSLRLKP